MSLKYVFKPKALEVNNIKISLLLHVRGMQHIALLRQKRVVHMSIQHLMHEKS